MQWQEHLNRRAGIARELEDNDIKAGDSVSEIVESVEPVENKEQLLKLIKEKGVDYICTHLAEFSEFSDTLIANDLIEAGWGWAVAVYLNKFKDLDHKAIANALIEAGQGEAVAENLNKFKDLDHKAIANALIEAGQGWGVAKNLNKFKDLDHKAIANDIIKAGEGWSVAKYLYKFKDLDHKAIANDIIKAGEGKAVADCLYNFKELDLDLEVATNLIEAGQGEAVAENLNKFKDLDHKAIANALIEAGQGWGVAKNLNNFKDLDHKAIVNDIIKAGKGEAVVDYLFNFKDLDHKAIANALIKAGKGGSVAVYLNNFKDLDHKAIANALIEAGKGGSVAVYLNNFKDLDHKAIANALIEAGKGEAVAENLDKFKDLDHKAIANALIEAGKGEAVANNLDNFKDLDYKAIANALIEAGQGRAVAYRLDKFKGLDHKMIANDIIKAGYGKAVADCLYNFKKLDLDLEVATNLIKAGQGRAVAYRLDKFKGLDHKMIANDIIKAGYGKDVAVNLDNFKDLDSEVANELIKAGQGRAVAYRLDKFKGLDHKMIANDIIKAGQGWGVPENLDKFKDLDHKAIANELIKAGQGRAVAENLDKFKDLDHKAMSNALIEAGQGRAVAENLDKFKDLDHKAIANALIEAGWGWAVAVYLNKFKDLDHTAIANELIEAGEGRAVAENLDKFKDLDSEVATNLIKAGQGGYVAEYLYNFKDLDEVWAYSAIVRLGDSIKLNTLQSIISFFKLKNIIGELKQRYPDYSISDDVYLFFGEKSDWQKLLGDERMKNFLQTVNGRTDKLQEVARNAFTHTELDRASKFFQFLNNNGLFKVNVEEFDIATEYIDKYSLATNKLLYSYFRALKFLALLPGEGPVHRFDALMAEGKMIPEGISRALCLEMEKNEVMSMEILETKYKQFAARVYSGEKITADYLKTVSNFEKTLLQAIVGFDTHSYGGSGKSFDQIIQDFISYQVSSSYKKFPMENDPEKNYRPIDFRSKKIEYEIDVSKLEKPDSDYQVLRREFLHIFNDNLSRREILGDLVDSIVFKVKPLFLEKIQQLKESKDQPFAEKKIANINESLSKLDYLGDSLLKLGSENGTYDDLMTLILSFDKNIIRKLEQELRTIVFVKTVKRSAREGFVGLAENLKKDEVTVESVSGLENLLKESIGEHILNKENIDGAWSSGAWQAMLDAKGAKRFDIFKLFESQLSSLQEVVHGMKKNESNEGGFNIRCYPSTDDFTGELSGYLGNACYTKVYPLLKLYPSNLIPFKFVSEHDQDNRELFGSVLVFELKDEDNNKVVLLRAFNVPRESQIDVGKFIENFIEQITPVLKARGIKRILVPGHDGAISNYSLIRNHMHHNYIDGKPKISLAEHFAFNGYDITHDCYVAREL